MTQRKTKYLFTGLLIFMALMLPVRPARADLAITPVRVVFQDRDRSATIQLVNLTTRTNVYRLSWLIMTMDEKGRYTVKPVKPNEADPHSVPGMVVFSPRSVTIEPHGQQTIRLSLRRPADLPFGEYRAHLALVRMAKQGPEQPDPNAKGVELAINVNLGFSVPVIVRSGEDKDLKVALAAPNLIMGLNKKPALGIEIDRVAGTFSTYGTIEAYWQPPTGPEKKIGSLDNMALFPEMKKRITVVPLTESPASGKMRVVYKGKYESEDKIWDEKVFPIGK